MVARRASLNATQSIRVAFLCWKHCQFNTKKKKKTDYKCLIVTTNCTCSQSLRATIPVQNGVGLSCSSCKYKIKAGPPPLEAILVIFGRRALIFFCLKALGKKWKMTPLLCACAVVITLETQKCRKRAPRSVEFNFFINCDRQKRFSQNERRRVDLQNVASDFLIFA